MNPLKRPETLKTAFIILAGFAILIVLFSLVQSYTLVHPPRRPPIFDPSDYGMSYETIAFDSLDGLELKGWLIPNNRSDSLIIVCHGHGANKGDVLFAARFLHNSGYNILLFDFRAHGESQGDIATLGWLEPSDLKGAIEYVKNRLDPESIGVMGFSMGGATAITTAGQINDIKAVVADSAFADRSRLIKKAVNLPLLDDLTVLSAQIQGMNMHENLPIDYAGEISPNAILIIQGDRDRLVETEDAELLYNSAKDPRELWLVENTPHVRAYQTQKQEYERRVVEFFDRYLKS